MHDLEKHKLVLVDWVDSHGWDGWTRKDEVDFFHQDLNMRSVGYISKEDEKFIVIVATISKDCFNSPMIIPREAIKSIQPLIAISKEQSIPSTSTTWGGVLGGVMPIIDQGKIELQPK